ncbi:MAG: YbjN domain-containing protein [Patescibacteria group bacterium]
MSENDERAERPHPLDAVEALATGKEFLFERYAENELELAVHGRLADYRVAFTWMPQIEILHFSCTFELAVPKHAAREADALTELINRQLWVGHFERWEAERFVMFRHALVLAGQRPVSEAQCMAVLSIALEMCEQYYPAYQYVAWAGKTAQEALDAVSFDTSGTA